MPPKEDKKNMKSERDRYIYVQPVEAYKQQIAKEANVLQNQTKQNMNKLESHFSCNNNYLAMFKQNPNLNNSKAIKVENRVDAQLNVNYKFCQKCHRDRAYCKHNKQLLEDNPYTVNILSSHQIGKLPPIDNIKFNQGKKEIINYFHVNSMRNHDHENKNLESGWK